MAHLNYYQHSARRFARKHYKENKNAQDACERGFIAGFELAIKSLQETDIAKNREVITWIDVWTNILTRESEWDY